MDVVRATELNRNMVMQFYKEAAQCVDMDVIEKLCRLFNCKVGELFEITNDAAEAQRNPGREPTNNENRH